jgi:hypothetical protein
MVVPADLDGCGGLAQVRAVVRRWAMAGPRSNARELGAWLRRRWRTWPIVLVLAPVVGPAIAVFCLVWGVHAVSRSRSQKVAEQISRGETLDAAIAALLPAAVCGCTVWGLRLLLPSPGWGWIPALLVAGFVTLVAGVLPAFYIVGYSQGVAQAEAYPHPLAKRRSPKASLGEQMLRPFRQRRP